MLRDNIGLTVLLLLIPFFLNTYDVDTYDFLEHHTEVVSPAAFYTPYPTSNNNKKLPFCFFAHIIEQLSYITSGYIIINSGLTLQENLKKINATSYWPVTWFNTFGNYGSCFYMIAKTVLQVFLLRYGINILKKYICPEELRKKVKHQNQCQTKQEKIRNI